MSTDLTSQVMQLQADFMNSMDTFVELFQKYNSMYPQIMIDNDEAVTKFGEGLTSLSNSLTALVNSYYTIIDLRKNC